MIHRLLHACRHTFNTWQPPDRPNLERHLVNDQYDPRTYWDRVADEIGDRPSGQELAGDDSPVYRYKRARLVEALQGVPVHGNALLEVGCGPGGNLGVYLKADHNVLPVVICRRR